MNECTLTEKSCAYLTCVCVFVCESRGLVINIQVYNYVCPRLIYCILKEKNCSYLTSALTSHIVCVCYGVWRWTVHNVYIWVDLVHVSVCVCVCVCVNSPCVNGAISPYTSVSTSEVMQVRQQMFLWKSILYWFSSWSGEHMFSEVESSQVGFIVFTGILNPA